MPEQNIQESTRIIKRYANRKLYDTMDSRYVTLEHVAELIKAGEDLVVVDKETDQDLTSVTLAQIIFEQEKQQRSFLPLSVLRRVIQTSGESLTDLVGQFTESADIVGRVFRRDEKGEISHAPMDEATEQAQRKLMREWIEGVQRTADDWQHRFDAGVHQVMDSLSPLAPLHRDVEDLRARLTSVETKMKDVWKHFRNQESVGESADDENP